MTRLVRARAGAHARSADRRAARFLAIVLLALAGGCAAPREWRFAERETRLDPFGPALRIERTSDLREIAAADAAWQRWIPGLAGVTRRSSHPDRAALRDLTGGDAISRALATLAREARAFRTVELAGAAPPAAPGFALGAELRDLSVSWRSQSYYLGIAALPLWLLGAASGGLETTMEFQLTLKNAAGETVWQDSFEERRERLVGFYYNADWRACFLDDVDSILRESWRQVLERVRAAARSEQ